MRGGVQLPASTFKNGGNLDSEIDKMKQEYAEVVEKPQAGSDFRFGLFFDYTRYCIHQRESVVSRLLLSAGLKLENIQYKQFLDIGCGDGNTLRDWVRFGTRPTNCFGIDVIEERISEAKSISPNMSFVCGDAKALPYKDGQFDIITLYTILSSVKSEESQKQILKEAKRVLSPHGFILVYEQNETVEGGRECGISANKLKELSGIDWYIKEIIPSEMKGLTYEKLAKLEQKTKKFSSYLALAKRR